MVFVYKNTGKRSEAKKKNYCPVSPLSAVSKNFEKNFSMVPGLPVIQLIF